MAAGAVAAAAHASHLPSSNHQRDRRRAPPARPPVPLLEQVRRRQATLAQWPLLVLNPATAAVTPLLLTPPGLPAQRRARCRGRLARGLQDDRRGAPTLPCQYTRALPVHQLPRFFPPPPSLYSPAAPPLFLAALPPQDSSLVAHVRALTHRFRSAMGAAGFELRGARDHPICPVMLGDARLAREFADESEAWPGRGSRRVLCSHPFPSPSPDGSPQC